MGLFQIPDEVRQEPYEEDGDVYPDGDDGKCGGCNWRADTVWMLAENIEAAINAFRENHRGLCSDCICEMIKEGGS